MTTDRDEIEALRQRLHAVEVEREQLVARLRDLELARVRVAQDGHGPGARAPATASTVTNTSPAADKIALFRPLRRPHGPDGDEATGGIPQPWVRDRMRQPDEGGSYLNRRPGRYRHRAGHRQGLPQPARFPGPLPRASRLARAGTASARCRARSTCRCRSRLPSSARRRSTRTSTGPRARPTRTSTP